MKKVLYFSMFCFFGMFVFAIFPKKNSKENSIIISGKVKKITEAGVNDLVFELANNNISYYINRGLESGFEIEKSKNDFINKNVTIHFANTWTPLAPFGTTSKHITQLEVNDKIVYSEFK